MEDSSPPFVTMTGITTRTADSTNSSPHPTSPNSANLPANLFEIQNFSINFASMYHSIFPPITSLPSSLSLSPSPCSSSNDDHNLTQATNCSMTDDVLFRTRLILEYRELHENHDLCLRRLRDLTKESDHLRRENAQLRLANTELVKLLSSKTAIDDLLATPNSPMHSLLMRDSQRIITGGGVGDGQNGEEAAYDIFSPTSVIRNNQFEGRDPQRIALPKSISVRSIGYVKANQLRANSDKHNRSATQPSPLNTHSRQVCIQTSDGGAGKREEEAVEFEVYNQGMAKTELCNKWQEIGGCPYGENCRFAHGLNELRPVMRHPRYKTEVCRMVLAGQVCPYAHRCHFRHSLSEQDR